MPAVVTRAEYLSFDVVGAFPAVPMNTPAWDVVDYSSLYDGPPVVGDDRPIPGSPGRLAVAREVDELVVALPLVVYGDRSYDDLPYADARIGVRANLDYLRTNVVLPPGTSTGTRPVTFHRLDGTTRAGPAVVLSPLSVAVAGPTSVRAVLRLVIPAGSLA